jgi:hypothetical protein
LEYLVDSQTQQIGELQGEVERLRDWSASDDANGGGVAIPSLVKIVADSASTMRQRLKAASTILAYRVQDSSVVDFTKRFLQSVCTSTVVATDHKLEASELLRKYEAPRVALRPDYRDGDEADKWSALLAEVKRRAAIHDPSFVPADDEEQPRVQHTDLASALREARLRVFAKARAQAGLPPVDVTESDDSTAGG